MRIRGSLTKGLLIALAVALIPVSAVSAQKITPGSTCKVLNQKVLYQNKTYTCIKSAKKLVWNKGVAIVKPTPTPTPTPTPAPTPTPSVISSTYIPYSYKSMCGLDPITPPEWKAMEQFMLSINNCSAALTIVSKSLPNIKPNSPITAKNEMQELELCRIKNMRGLDSFTGFPTDQYLNAFKQRRHPSVNTTFQIIPISTMDAPAGKNSPNQDYQKYFDYLKNWIDYNSDYGSNVKFRVPDQYFNIPIYLRDYKINHIPDRNSALKFINDVIKVVDPMIDFAGADMTILLIPGGSSIQLIQQGPLFNVMTNEGMLERITSVAPDTTPLGENRMFANLNHPIWWAHEFLHIGLNLDDHYGDGTSTFGKHGTGMWTMMSTGQTDLSTWEKWLMGMLDDRQVRCASATKASTHWLAPTTYRTQNEKLLVIPLSTSKAIVVESMRAAGLNYRLPKESEGALVFVLDTSLTQHGFGLELQLPTARPNPNAKPFFLSEAPFKINESIIIEGIKITVIESGDFGDVIKVEKVG